MISLNHDKYPTRIVLERAILKNCEPGARFPLHDHEGPEEIIILSDKIHFGDKIVSTGDYLMAGPGDVHDAEALEDSVFFIAPVGGAVLKG